MRFIPNYELKIIEDSNFDTEIENVEAILEKHKNYGNFIAFDNSKIYYEFFLSEKPRANIVIVHGLSEFTKKFYEITYYFLNQGYNVFIYDQRCHGLSTRLTDSKDILHVDRFKDYEKDLAQFIEQIVVPSEDKPIYLYSHSMGGAVSALYLANHPDKIEKAILSAPLFEPVVNSVPDFLARLSVGAAKIFLGSKKRFFLSHDFNPDVKYKSEYGTSEVRFNHNMVLRNSDRNYQSSPMSLGWVYNSLTIKYTVLKNRFIKKIKTPILIISAENDNMVKNSAQKIFASKCKTCDFVEIKGETHSLISSSKNQLENIMKIIFGFYSK